MTHSRRVFLSTVTRMLGGGACALLLPERLIGARRNEGTYLERTVFAMGTTVSIGAFGESRDHILHATSRAFSDLTRLERLFSVFIPSSDISRINRRGARDPVMVDPLTADLLRVAKTYHRRTDGAFDVTVERMMQWWGFREEAPEVERQEVDLPPVGLVGDEHLHVTEDNTVWLGKSGVGVDTGGIGVGYAVDRMAAILGQEGINSAFINHSGDVYGVGHPEDSGGWETVIPHPEEHGGELRSITIRDEALSTSTNSAQRRRRENKTVGHILDPRTGKNPERVVSITVVAPTSLMADALSTAAFVRGVERWDEPGCGFFAVLPDGEQREQFRR